jgi:D-ala D-ala ligase C-terminus
MSKYNNLLNLLNNNKKIKLLFVTPDYGEVYKYSKVNLDYFDKNKFQCDIVYITSNDITKTIKLFFDHDYDAVINLCDGYLNNKDNIPHINFIEELEKNNIPYTGSDKRVYSLSKMNICASQHTPKSYTNLDFNHFFPLFIKPNNLGCSELIDDQSVVYNEEQLQQQIEKILKKTDDIIIQEYLDGDEYTALVFTNKNNGVVCLDPLHIKFSNINVKYLTNDVKLNQFDDIIYEYDIEEKDKIKDICIKVYENLNLNSYVRMDIRCMKVVDINPYPEIFGPEEEEDLCDSIIRHCYDFDKFLIDILYDGVRKYVR